MQAGEYVPAHHTSHESYRNQGSLESIPPHGFFSLSSLQLQKSAQGMDVGQSKGKPKSKSQTRRMKERRQVQKYQVCAEGGLREPTTGRRSVSRKSLQRPPEADISFWLYVCLNQTNRSLLFAQLEPTRLKLIISKEIIKQRQILPVSLNTPLWPPYPPWFLLTCKSFITASEIPG